MGQQLCMYGFGDISVQHCRKRGSSLDRVSGKKKKQLRKPSCQHHGRIPKPILSSPQASSIDSKSQRQHRDNIEKGVEIHLPSPNIYF